MLIYYVHSFLSIFIWIYQPLYFHLYSSRQLVCHLLCLIFSPQTIKCTQPKYCTMPHYFLKFKSRLHTQPFLYNSPATACSASAQDRVWDIFILISLWLCHLDLLAILHTFILQYIVLLQQHNLFCICLKIGYEIYLFSA